jgi:hypothetical protein
LDVALGPGSLNARASGALGRNCFRGGHNLTSIILSGKRVSKVCETQDQREMNFCSARSEKRQQAAALQTEAGP